MKHFSFLLSLLLAIIVLTSCIAEKNSQPADTGNVIEIGAPLPDFEVTTLSGEVISGAELRRKPAIVCFFHTGCGDCQRELPLLEQLYKNYGSLYPFVCIGREQEATEVAVYWKDNALTLPVAPQPDRKVYSLFARHTIPRIYMTDEKGIVRAQFIESATLPELEKALSEITVSLN